jgi:ankyrin repeat protein
MMAQARDQPVSPPPDDPERPRQELARVKAFVQAGHSDLPKVKAMLEEEPALINASWDWGNGDWETALEGASHMAQTDIVTFLLQNGARANLFSMAVLGNSDAVTAMVQAEPAFFNTRGPHFLTLLYHAALSGRVELTEAIAAHLGDDSGEHFNQALRGAAQLGTVEMVDWLITNGVTNVNELNFWNETPLDVSIKRGDEAIADLLRKRGGVESSP